MRGARARDGFCATHLSTFGRECTRCESEAARREAIREQVLAGDLPVAEAVVAVPEWARLAGWLLAPSTADDDADCL